MNITTLKQWTHTRPSKKENMLLEIFGSPSVYIWIMAAARHLIKGYGKGVKRSVSISEFGESWLEVREIKRFSWRDIEVQRIVVAFRVAGVDRGGQVGGKYGAGGKTDVSSTVNGGVRSLAPEEIYLLLLQMNGPQKISDMTKTGADRDLVKDHVGLEE